MARTADEIGRTQDLGRRLPNPAARDEIGLLTSSFNGMLERLLAAQQKLAAALEAQNRFVADASHELRTPLTTIRSNAGLLAQRPDLRPEDRIAALQDIVGESERMNRLVQDLLTLARADAGQHLERAALDLRPLIEQVCRQAQNLHPDRSMNAAVAAIAPETEAAVVVGNADALKQLLWILVDNAGKHTEPGGHIEVGLARRDAVVERTVVDDGAGIPEADLGRIFERFYQSDQTRTQEGAGLGLSIAQWIAREHDGRIVAYNNQRRGATFKVELPAGRS
jgi:signal transduction histidine kinase